MTRSQVLRAVAVVLFLAAIVVVWASDAFAPDEVKWVYTLSLGGFAAAEASRLVKP